MICKIFKQFNNKNKFFVTKDDNDNRQRITVRLYPEIFERYKEYLDDEQIHEILKISENKKHVLKSIYLFRNNKPVEEWLTPFIVKTYNLNECCIKKELAEIDRKLEEKAMEIINKLR